MREIAPSLDPSVFFERSARRDIRWWMLLIVGAVFLYAGTHVDPATNCSSDGECAPWLVPLAAAVGGLALCAGIALLIVNPKSGSRIDRQSGLFHWWEWRNRSGQSSNEGVVAIADIVRIRVVNTSDSDHIYFYGNDGLLPMPDGEIVPWPYQDWAGRFVQSYPHIELVIVGS
jgi:hypothetical protein